jgi:GDSL-like Lipase/Acylhydrolase family
VRLLVAFVSTLLALVGCELALASLGRYTPPFYPPIPAPEDREVYEAFAPYGYRLRPSTSVAYTWPRQGPGVRTFTVTSNADGFRTDRELRAADPRPRVLVVGDSMVFGLGVEAHERFTEMLEARQPAWRVDNLGMPGFGPDLMVRSVDHLAGAVRPDVVVLCLYTDDFRRVRPEYAGMGFEIPRFVFVDGDLTSVPYPAPPFWNGSRLMQGAMRAYWSYSNAEWALNEAILERFLAVAVRDRFQPALVFVPAELDLETDRQRRARVERFATSRGVAYLDLTATLAGGRAVARFIPGDFHLSVAGHDMVAHALLSFISGMLHAVRP